MTYNFDIQQMLDAFDGDPEKLANAFADSLNEELANNKTKKRLEAAAMDVADAWEEFVNEYFDTHPNEVSGLDINEYYVDDDSAIKLMDLLIKFTPYISLFNEYMTKLDGLSNAVKETAKPVVDKTVNTGTQVFESTMKKFFKDNNI